MIYRRIATIVTCLAAVNACILALIARGRLPDGSGIDDSLARDTAHWGIEDRAALVGSEHKAYAFFRRVYSYLDARIKLFTSLPIVSLDKVSCSNGWRPSATLRL
jgi:hypothetical protein